MEADNKKDKVDFKDKFNTENNYSTFLKDIVDAKNSQSLFIIVGAGVSISQLYPDWNLYVDSLIKYWQFNLDELVTHNEDTYLKEVQVEDIYFLRKLSETNLSNKRKVDLVHHIINKYCESNDNEIRNRLFKKNVLNFEKKFFSKYKPMISSNVILRSLVKLYPIFITTNYDLEIEKSLINEERIQPNIIKDISLVSKDRARPEYVLHIHGIPSEDTNLDFFISSSKSYSDLYYRQNQYHKKFKEIFIERKNTLVLFVGCSMEEDEVLSLFDFEYSNIKYYSLMKFNSQGSDIVLQKYYNEVIKEYYSSKDIEFIWFGEEYDDLQYFLEKLLKDVDVLETTESNQNFNAEKLRNTLLGIGTEI